MQKMEIGGYHGLSTLSLSFSVAQSVWEVELFPV